MRHRWLFIFIAVLSAQGTTSAAFAERDPLWAKALGLTGKNLERRPGKMVEEERIFTIDRELKRHTVSTFEFKREGDGEPLPVLVTAVRDGKEVTDERRQELKKRKRKGKLTKDEHNIFHPAWYEHNEVHRTELEEIVDGHPCVAFEYTVKADKARWDGVVFLDKNTGAPRKLVSSPDKVPGQEEVDAWDVALEFYYVFNQPHDWHLARMVIRAKFKTTVAWLIPFTGRFRTELTFSDYP